MDTKQQDYETVTLTPEELESNGFRIATWAIGNGRDDDLDSPVTYVIASKDNSTGWLGSVLTPPVKTQDPPLCPLEIREAVPRFPSEVYRANVKYDLNDLPQISDALKLRDFFEEKGIPYEQRPTPFRLRQALAHKVDICEHEAQTSRTLARKI